MAAQKCSESCFSFPGFHEHLPEPQLFFARLVELLAAGGVLVASVPTTPSVDLNPHHLHDFTAAQFRRMGARHGLVEAASHVQVQRVGLGEDARRQDPGSDESETVSTSGY